MPAHAALTFFEKILQMQTHETETPSAVTEGASNSTQTQVDFTDLELRLQALNSHGQIMLPLCEGLQCTATREAPHDISQWFGEAIADPLNRPKKSAPYVLRSSELKGLRAGSKAYSGFRLLAWDIDAGDVGLDRIEELCKPLFGSAIWCLYSTASARQGHMRSRILALTAEPWSLGRWADWQHALTLYLSSQGVELDGSAGNPNQLVGLPNVAETILDKDGKFLANGRHPEGTIDLISDTDISGTPIVWDHRVFGTELLGDNCTSALAKQWLDQARNTLAAAAQAAELARMARAARRADLAKGPALDAIGRWKTDTGNDIESVLERCGYVPHPFKLNWWRSPLQKSGSYGVEVFEDGNWHSYSNSDKEAGVGKESKNGGRFGDAWSLHVHFEKGGNFALAVAELHNQANVGAAFTGVVDTRTPAEIAAAMVPAWARPRDADELVHNSKGGILPIRSNIEKAIVGGKMCFKVGFDEFKSVSMIRGVADSVWRPYVDDDLFHIARCLEDQGFLSIQKQMLKDAVSACARLNSFDSAQQWLNGLSSTGQCLVNDLMVKGFGAERSPYTEHVGQYILSALAGRVLQPGIKVDMIPVLVGAEGVRKSSACEALAPHEDSFMELDLSVSEADLFRLMKGTLVIEHSELSGLRGKGGAHVKRFVTSKTNRFIEKYETTTTAYKRRSLMIGTTNEKDFLTESIGNRRWLPIEVVRPCDVDWIIANRDQLWAEGAELFKSNGVMFTQAEELAKAEHDNFKHSDPWDSLIDRWLSAAGFGGMSPRQGRVMTADVLQGIGLRADQMTRSAEMRVGECLKRLGYLRTKQRIDGVPRWGFSKAKEDFQI